ncbi:RNA polymerase sigma factor, sigma-70 family (plasmid) [Gemmatirosa kalamazoonensis]|uniref:RNA polymerase sigma factor, sigma-70 family n=1 Tax=Gemmatirosa kalamazoonensis TaxID=861299 RepID=W0RQB4_9BACT|nr:RNA polymerase sigma factor, sigma-70 family [Gemmatirosa kalamazoonensis]
MHDRDDPAGGGDASPRRSPRTGATNDEAAAEDAALVRRARAGDEGAFGALVRKHVRAAHAAALVVLGDAEEADDAVQDAFVSALRRLEDCRPEEKFRPWLLTIVRNRAIDLRRRSRVRRADSLDVVGETVAASPAQGPLRAAERADARAHLAAALATLTDVRREVVLLHDLEGWSHREIGEHLGLAEGTVRAHLFWARRDLRRRLSAEWRRDDDDA